MYILCLFEAVFISLVLTLGKKGLECEHDLLHYDGHTVHYIQCCSIIFWRYQQYLVLSCLIPRLTKKAVRQNIYCVTLVAYKLKKEYLQEIWIP